MIGKIITYEDLEKVVEAFNERQNNTDAWVRELGKKLGYEIIEAETIEKPAHWRKKR